MADLTTLEEKLNEKAGGSLELAAEEDPCS